MPTSAACLLLWSLALVWRVRFSPAAKHATRKPLELTARIDNGYNYELHGAKRDFRDLPVPIAAMSKQVASAASSGPAAPAPQPPAAYGAAAMEDLLESIHWSGCEVLNATKTDAVGSLLKQGLRDQELMIVESDADEQLLISIAFKAKVKVHSIAIKAPADGRAPKSLKLFVNKPSMDCSDGESMVRAHAQEFPSPRWEVADVLAPTRACTTAANASVNYRWRIRRC
jgi:hypothetical protein